MSGPPISLASLPLEAQRIASLQAIHPDLWPASSLAQGVAQGVGGTLRTSVPSGHTALDAELPGGGWPCGCLTELMVRAMGMGELRLLAPALRLLAQSGKQILLLAPPTMPYAPALAALGIPPESFLVVRAGRGADRLWAIEQSLKSNSFGALLAWLDADVPPEALRRFHLTARQAQGPVFLFRPMAAQHQASAAPLRMALLPRGYPGLAVQILKRRGPVSLAPIPIAVPLPQRAMRPLEEAWAGAGVPVSSNRSAHVPSQPTRPALDRLPLPGASLPSDPTPHPARIGPSFTH